MAASDLGASNTQILSLKLSQKTRFCLPSLPHSIKAESRAKAWRHAGLMVPQRSNKVGAVCPGLSSLFTEIEPAALGREEHSQQRSPPAPVSQLIPNSDKVKSLLTEICDTKSITEFELKLNGFHLHITRALSGDLNPSRLPSYPPASASSSANSGSEVPVVNGLVSTPSLAITKVGAFDGGIESIRERAADEGLVIIQSPKVGFFRISRTIKGQLAPPACKEKQVVKEGQVICYIEQLGGQTPVETGVAGEVVKILVEDGEPVGYGDAIIAVLPSFPGIKNP